MPQYQCQVCGVTKNSARELGAYELYCEIDAGTLVEVAAAAAPAIAVVATPTYIAADENMKEILKPSAAAKLRAQLCKDWGISSKSHKSHGANFSSNQTLQHLIDDIVAPVSGGGERERVRQLVIDAYNYDIDTGGMAS